MLSKEDMEYVTKELEKNWNNREEWWKIINHYNSCIEFEEVDKRC